MWHWRWNLQETIVCPRRQTSLILQQGKPAFIFWRGNVVPINVHKNLRESWERVGSAALQQHPANESLIGRRRGKENIYVTKPLPADRIDTWFYVLLATFIFAGDSGISKTFWCSKMEETYVSCSLILSHQQQPELWRQTKHSWCVWLIPLEPLRDGDHPLTPERIV